MCVWCTVDRSRAPPTRWSFQGSMHDQVGSVHSTSSHPCCVCSFHPDGALVCTGDVTGNALLWDLRSGKMIHAFQVWDLDDWWCIYVDETMIHGCLYVGTYQETDLWGLLTQWVSIRDGEWWPFGMYHLSIHCTVVYGSGSCIHSAVYGIYGKRDVPMSSLAIRSWSLLHDSHRHHLNSCSPHRSMGR